MIKFDKSSMVKFLLKELSDNTFRCKKISKPLLDFGSNSSFFVYVTDTGTPQTLHTLPPTQPARGGSCSQQD